MAEPCVISCRRSKPKPSQRFIRFILGRSLIRWIVYQSFDECPGLKQLIFTRSCSCLAGARPPQLFTMHPCHLYQSVKASAPRSRAIRSETSHTPAKFGTASRCISETLSTSSWMLASGSTAAAARGTKKSTLSVWTGWTEGLAGPVRKAPEAQPRRRQSGRAAGEAFLRAPAGSSRPGLLLLVVFASAAPIGRKSCNSLCTSPSASLPTSLPACGAQTPVKAASQSAIFCSVSRNRSHRH